MGVPFTSWTKKLPRRTATESGGRPTRESMLRNASLECDTKNFAAMVRENIYCEQCKKCFTERKKLNEHKQRCPALKASNSNRQQQQQNQHQYHQQQQGGNLNLAATSQFQSQIVQMNANATTNTPTTSVSDSASSSCANTASSESPINFNFLFD